MTATTSMAGSGLRIASVTTEIIDLPLRRPHSFAFHSIDRQSYVLVRIRTTDDVEGLGEGACPGGPWWGGESVEAMRSTIDLHLSPLLINEDPTRIQHHLMRMDRVVAGNNFAKAALEMALYDVIGKSFGIPVYHLLGGQVHESLPVLWAVATGNAESDIAEAEVKQAETGHRRFKIKLGFQDPDSDATHAMEVCRALAGRAGVIIDTNGAWDENTAMRLLPRLEDAGVELFEQPVARWNFDGMARLADRLSAPVMADESVCTVQDALRLSRRRAADVFSVKISKAGGITRMKQVAAIADASDIACMGGSALETSLLTAAALHVCCTLPSVREGCELFGPLFLADDIVENPLTYQDGRVWVPEGPGFGVRLDEDKVAKYRRGER